MRKICNEWMVFLKKMNYDRAYALSECSYFAKGKSERSERESDDEESDDDVSDDVEREDKQEEWHDKDWIDREYPYADEFDIVDKRYLALFFTFLISYLKKINKGIYEEYMKNIFECIEDHENAFDYWENEIKKAQKEKRSIIEIGNKDEEIFHYFPEYMKKYDPEWKNDQYLLPRTLTTKIKEESKEAEKKQNRLKESLKNLNYTNEIEKKWTSESLFYLYNTILETIPMYCLAGRYSEKIKYECY